MHVDLAAGGGGHERLIPGPAPAGAGAEVVVGLHAGDHDAAGGGYALLLGELVAHTVLIAGFVEGYPLVGAAPEGCGLD